MNRRNYQKEMENVIEHLQHTKQMPSLLLHSCCAPCSTHVLDTLSPYFLLTVLYYNPNLDSLNEAQKRAKEQKRLIAAMPSRHPIAYLEGSYEPEKFYQTIKGHEQDREGGERCFLCYRLRLEETARRAKEEGYDYFTTTLSVSPLKNAGRLNEIGEELAQKYGIAYLCSDFKKKNGYLHSIELSKQYCLYRQNYCGCIFSKRS